jgi:hypothetical protein
MHAPAHAFEPQRQRAVPHTVAGGEKEMAACFARADAMPGDTIGEHPVDGVEEVVGPEVS